MEERARRVQILGLITRTTRRRVRSTRTTVDGGATLAISKTEIAAQSVRVRHVVLAIFRR